ncbi:MAG: hypothetical protein O3A20_08625 [Planctomycetota bacterium]|nr:hypothetical protein [Planctomycetota bacterium]
MLACTAVLLLGLVPPAQEPESSVLVERAAQGARGIARDFALPNWARLLIDKDRRLSKTDEDHALLGLAECDVLLAEADLEKDIEKRLKIYAQAGGAYGVVLEQYGSTEVAKDAQRKVGQTAFQYAGTLDQLFATEDVTDAQRAELIAAAEPFFKTALTAMNALIRWFDQLPNDHPDRDQLLVEVYFPTQFFRAITYTSWARLYPSGSLERDQHSKTAIDLLENFALEAGGPFGMQAYRLTADVFVLRQDYSDALDYYRYVLDTCRDILKDEDAELSPGQIIGYEGAVMDASLGLLNMYRESGDGAGFAAGVTEFETWMRADGISLQTPAYQIRLVEAKDLVDQGRISEALALAQEVANDKPRSALQLQANAVMAYAIENAPPDAEISLDVLYQAAQGSMQSNEIERAVGFWRALIARLPGSGREAEYLGQAYSNLASSWNTLGDGLLAAVTAASGVKAGVSDEVYGRRLATMWSNKADTFYRSRSSDEVLKQWNSDAVSAFGMFSEDSTPVGILWRAAQLAWSIAEDNAAKAKGEAADSKEARDAIKAYREAADAYAKLPKDCKYYDKASVQRGLSSHKISAWEVGEAETAIPIFEAYLLHIANPANAVTDPTAVKYRKESEPTAVFYLGDCHRLLAQNGRLGAWEQMITTYEGFGAKFTDQPGLHEAVRDARVEAWIALGEPGKAELEFQSMLDENMANSRIAYSAWKLQREFSTRADAATSAAERLPLLTLAAKYLGVMNQRAAKPSGAGLYSEAQWRSELEEWTAVEKLAAAALEPAAELPEANRFGALALRIAALLELRRVVDAVPLLEILRKQNPNERRVLSFSIRVLGGFLIVENGQVREVPGEGTQASLMKAFEAANTLIQLAEHEAGQLSISKFQHKPWWEARVDQIYVIYRLGQVDTAQAGKHKSILEGLRNQAPDFGEAVCGRIVPLKLQWLAQR